MKHASRPPLRGIELGITCAVHALAVAAGALAFNWQDTGEEGRKPLPQIMLVAMHDQDQTPASAKAAAAADTPKPAPLASRPALIRSDDPMPALPQDDEAPAPPAAPEGREAPAQEVQSYRRAIMARLEARRFYPDVALRRDWQGSGAVLFRIERSGRLLDATIANSTGHGALDKAALGIVQRAAPFPAIPDSLPDELAITMPVAFLLEHPSGAQP
jgi:TonB family protein